MPARRLARAIALLSLAAAASPSAIKQIDLTGPLATRSAWQFTATQAPAAEDPTGGNGNAPVPGKITLCLHKAGAAACDPQLLQALRPSDPDDDFVQPHFLGTAAVVRSSVTGPALLMVETASVHSGDGDQLRLTQLLAYSPDTDTFQRVYDHAIGQNNSQEIRYVAAGAIAGDVVAAEPTDDAPYAFWITVSHYTPGHPYQQVLRYRSATLYGDGNRLAVIDSEMPNIQEKLGVWHPGLPLPLPASACLKPHLKQTELWCD